MINYNKLQLCKKKKTAVGIQIYIYSGMHMHATNRLYGDSALVMNITPGGARLPMTFVQRYQLSGCNVLNKNWDCLIWLGSESTDCVNRASPSVKCPKTFIFNLGLSNTVYTFFLNIWEFSAEWTTRFFYNT